MSAVIPFARPSVAGSTSWSQQELAEFYRVEAALLRAGIGIASEHGLSDEGEPWFVFCRPDGDAIMHFARIDGSYLIASEVLDRPVRGADFRAMIDQIARLHPNLLPIPAVAAGTKLVVHPAALLAALVAASALSLSSQDAHAGEIDVGTADVAPHPSSIEGGVAHDPAQPARAKGTVAQGEQADGRKQAEAIILSTMLFAAEALASDHGDGNTELSHLWSDLAGGTANHTAHGETAAGTSGGSEAGSGGTPSTQPAVLSTQGSGASQDSTTPGIRTDTAPAIRGDAPGEGAKLPGREADHHAPGTTDVGLTRVSAETGATGTSGQQITATGHSESIAALPGGSASDGGDQRATSSQPPSPDASVQARLTEVAQFDTGSGAASQARVTTAAQAETSKASAAISRDADDRSVSRDHGTQADDDHGHSGHGAPAQAATRSDDDDHGPASPRTVTGPAASAQGEGPGRAGHNTGPATDASPHAQSGETGVSQGSEQAANPREPSTGHGPSSEHGSNKGPGPAAEASPQAQDVETGPSQGPEQATNAREPSGGHGPSSEPGTNKGSGPAADASPHAQDAAASASQGPEQAANAHEPSTGHGPSSAQGPTAPADSGPAHAASASSGPSHGGPNEANAGLKDTASHGAGSAAADQGHSTGPGSESPAAHNHSDSDASSVSAARNGPKASGTAHADPGQPEHGASPSADGQAATAQAAANDPPASHGGSGAKAASSPDSAPQADPGHGQAVTTAHSASPPDRPAPSPATVDPHGNLVFHGDRQQAAAAPPASHGPDEASVHPSIGLVGVSDHGHPVHDLYHHS